SAPGRLGCSARGYEEALAAGEQRGERGGVRATGAVRGGHVVPGDGDLDVVVPVEKMVDGLVAVPAGHDNRGRPELVQPLGELAARSISARERLRLEQVRRDDGRERKEPPDERCDGVVLEQLRAGARDHHRVDDEGYRMLGDIV